jgi:uncharacterized protein
VELTLDRPGDHLFVRSVSSTGIEIVNRLYPGPLILSAGAVVDHWDAGNPDDLSDRQLKPVFDLEPEVVLIGTGASQIFLAPEVMMCFYQRGVGVEVMTTDAACRTFNVLVSEGRKVVAALLPPGFTP